MLAIRLVADPADRTAAGSTEESAAPLVLPVRGPDPGTEADHPSGEHGVLVPTALAVPAELGAEAAALLPLLPHTGAAGTAHICVRALSTPQKLLLIGVGDADEAGWRAAGAGLARAAAREPSITIAMPVDAAPESVRGLAEGLWLASYRFRMPDRPADDDDRPTLAEVQVVVAEPAAYEACLTQARVVAGSTRLARDLTNTPSSLKSPAWFADQVTEAAGRAGLVVTVRGPEELAAEGFGGILAVGSGSAQGPRLVECGWSPPDARTHVVLVGKGITFDTGGISIKPVPAMKLMRKDMGGAAAVLAATIGAAMLRLPVRITALAPLAENMVSGTAYRPGDVIRHYGGLTSESTNTDAEGRLVLADAIAYAVDRLEPDLLVDLATLTGANAVALGKRTAALYSESDELADALVVAAADAGELAWRMPLPGDYVEYLGSEVADLYSAPTQGAGSILAALYLREFTGGVRGRWAHIDMSAPSWADGNDAELVKGATGWGVRGLLRWLATL